MIRALLAKKAGDGVSPGNSQRPLIVISQDQPVPFTEDRPCTTSSSGFADVVGFGVDGVIILRNVENPKIFNAIKDFGLSAGGWRTDRHVRLLANITGSGNADIVGFGENGVYISFNNSNNTFSPIRNVLDEFGFATGWRVDRHIRYLADLRNIGRADIIGFGNDGVFVSENQAGGIFSSPKLALADFGFNEGGWKMDRHLRLLADVTGNKLPDIIGFGENNVVVARNNGNGTFSPAHDVINNFTIGCGGWHIDNHPRFAADLTGDGKADIIGFGDAGVYVSLNNGSVGFGPVNLVVSDFGETQGWKVDHHPRQIADLTGDGRGDVIGFGDAGVYVARNNSDGTFQPAKLVLSAFGALQGWSFKKHLRFVVDLTGDGRADIIGFGENSIWVSFNDGKGNFGPVREVVDQFAFNEGLWDLDKTIRYVVNLGSGRF